MEIPRSLWQIQVLGIGRLGHVFFERSVVCDGRPAWCLRLSAQMGCVLALLLDVPVWVPVSAVGSLPRFP